tara:strand:- start:1774 stop:1968 length:195 start_codon:yes stop_codon:yes gene_type:complete
MSPPEEKPLMVWSGRLGWSRRVTDELFHIILDDIQERAPLDRLDERLRAEGTLSETSKRELVNT